MDESQRVSVRNCFFFTWGDGWLQSMNNKKWFFVVVLNTSRCLVGLVRGVEGRSPPKALSWKCFEQRAVSVFYIKAVSKLMCGEVSMLGRCWGTLLCHGVCYCCDVCVCASMVNHAVCDLNNKLSVVFCWGVFSFAYSLWELSKEILCGWLVVVNWWPPESDILVLVKRFQNQLNFERFACMSFAEILLQQQKQTVEIYFLLI